MISSLFISSVTLIVAFAASAALAFPVIPSASDCNRTALSDVADAYVAAKSTGNVSLLQQQLSGNWSYQENNKVIDIKQGAMSKPLKIDHRRTNFDMQACATYTELVAADPSDPHVIGTQIHHASDMTVKMIDSVVSTTGSWLFNANNTLRWVEQETWDTIPEAKRDRRSLIQAAGDAYLDMWSNATASIAVPWGTPCARLEGGQYTGKGKPDDSCKPGIPSNHNQAANTHRRYVIDEAMGSVNIFCVWEHMMNASDSHEFRLEGGKLRFVHTMTTCGSQTCRL